MGQKLSEPEREKMQYVVAGETDGTVHLVGDSGTFGGRFTGADLRRRGLEKNRVVEGVAIGDGVGSRARGGESGGGFAGKPSEGLLKGLEFSDRSLEGGPLLCGA